MLRSTVHGCHEGKSLKRGCCFGVTTSKRTRFEGWCGSCSGYSTRAKKMGLGGFPWPCLARRVGKRSRHCLPDRATLNAKITRHGVRPGPKHARGVHARPLRAPQPRARETTRRRPSRAYKCANKVHFVHTHILRFAYSYEHS